MADLKVKLTFDDPSATSFTYDKANGLKSFSLMTEAKSSAETLDYSVKSNAGSFSAKDIVGSNEINVNNANFQLPSSNLVATNICFNENDGYYYIGVKSSIANNKVVCYRTNNFSTFEEILITNKYYNNLETLHLDVLGDYIIFVCLDDDEYLYTRSYNYVTNDFTYQGGQISYEDPNRKIYCAKTVNNIFFMYLKDRQFGSPALLRINATSPNSYSFISASYDLSIYDIAYTDNVYTFLTANGIYDSTDLQTFTLRTNEIYVDEIVYDKGAIGQILEKDTNGEYTIPVNYFFTGGNSIYRYKTGEYVINEFRVRFIPDKMFSFKGNLFFILDSGLNIYYTNNFSSISKFKSKSSGLTFNNYYVSTNTLSFVYNVNNNYSISYTDNLFNINRINTINSLYEWLLTKPEYSTITIDATLDGRTLGNFVNNGKIEYDNDTREFNLQIKNMLTLLQEKKYKRQFDKKSTDVSAVNFLLVLLVKCNQALNGTMEFEDMSQETQDYIRSINIKYPYFEEDTLWNHLNKFCEMAQLVMYPNGSKIVIERWV